jgi:hypothetical protein
MRLKDLYPGPPPTGQRLAQTKWRKWIQAECAYRSKHTEPELWFTVDKLESVKNHLGGLLATKANLPEGDELDRLFHRVCAMHALASIQLEQYQVQRKRAADGGF